MKPWLNPAAFCGEYIQVGFFKPRGPVPPRFPGSRARERGSAFLRGEKYFYA